MYLVTRVLPELPPDWLLEASLRQDLRPILTSGLSAVNVIEIKFHFLCAD
jgi:hypothetical protein